MIWILVALYLLIIFIEVPFLMKHHLYKELGAFAAVFVIGVYMSLAFYYGWPLAGPFEAIMTYLEATPTEG